MTQLKMQQNKFKFKLIKQVYNYIQMKFFMMVKNKSNIQID